VYRWCTRKTQHGIALPRLHQIRFKLFLACPNPRRIVFFGDPDASMAEQYAHTLNRRASEQQFNGKSVAEPVLSVAKSLRTPDFNNIQSCCPQAKCDTKVTW